METCFGALFLIHVFDLLKVEKSGLFAVLRPQSECLTVGLVEGGVLVLEDYSRVDLLSDFVDDQVWRGEVGFKVGYLSQSGLVRVLLGELGA